MATAKSQTTAMLYALTSPSENLSEKDFNAWYDTRHAPSRAKCPGVHHVSRFSASDDKEPRWLAMYEIEDLSALQTDEYKKAREADGDDESTMFSRLSRRVYKLISEQVADGYDDYLPKNNRWLVPIGLQPVTGKDLSVDEFHRWYEEEHIPLLMKVPGWLRSTRWELVDAKGVALAEVDQSQFARFLALHEWKNTEFSTSKEMEYAISTPWRNSVIARCDEATEERRTFKLWRQFDGGEAISMQGSDEGEVKSNRGWLEKLRIHNASSSS